ncbi:MAG: DEAD/DEAH box helicase family protein [Burkholderiaceae bacterium]
MNLFHDSPNYKSASFPEPRPFQKTAHDSLRHGFLDGHKNQLIMAPTGAGKSYLGHRIAHEALLKGKKAVFVCDREALIDQTSETADEYGLSAHAIIKADHWRRDTSMPYQIASIQTVMRRGFWPKADVIIIDEAHTQYKGWVDHAMNTDAACIGLSATPFSKGLGKIFTNLINAATMDELTNQGILVPMHPLTCVRPDMTGAPTKASGEWTDKAAEERGMGIIGDVVAEWLKHGEGRKTIVFGSTIAHCEELARQFIDAGVMAATYTTNTKKAERDQLLAEFKKHDSMVRVLISVEALAKGFDVKDVGCVVDCRPLRKSLSTAIQMWGRGLRSSKETGKQDCILLDHSGNILRFLEDYEEIYFNGLSALDTGEKLDKTIRDKEDYEPKGCPSCGYKPFSKRCMACGYEHQAPALDAAQAGEMQAVMLGKKKLADDRRHLWEQLCTYARGHSAPEKQAGRAWHLFKDMTGANPPSGWKFVDTPNVEITRNVQNKIRSMNIAFVKGRKAA